jgi:uncharacterized protein
MALFFFLLMLASAISAISAAPTPDYETMTQHIEDFVKEQLGGVDGSHDWFHIHRVRNLALTIGRKEIARGQPVDLHLVEISALLHDISDSKVNFTTII